MAEIIVGIGSFAEGSSGDILKTSLGSCVAVILYDRVCKIGGMLHVMLPKAPSENSPGLSRYADTGIKLLLDAMKKSGCRERNMDARLFGGAKVASLIKTNIGEINVEAVKTCLKMHGIRISVEKTGGDKGCVVAFDTGENRCFLRIFGRETETF